MQLPLTGHPQRIEPFRNFLNFIAKTDEPVLITGPTGSGKKRIVDFLLDHGLLNQEPVFHLNGLRLTEDLWGQTHATLKSKGTLVVEGIQSLPWSIQARFKEWLTGQTPLLSEGKNLPPDWRILAVAQRPEEIWEDLLYQFAYHVHLPSLTEIIEDIPYHIKYFLRDKPIRYLRYLFLLKIFFHQWQGNIRELQQCLLQAMAYYHSMSMVKGFQGEDEVFGEKKIRYYQDILKGEWWYFPYRFLPGFTEQIAFILNHTDFRAKILENQWVIPLLPEEPGFLVFDLTDTDFEKKAAQVYYTFSEYLSKPFGQNLQEHCQANGQKK
jgi:transcriptional regulator with AAA-type ATPase domain